jgi:hypothetical protein
MRDPRACSIPPPEFNHLTLAEVAEYEGLLARSSSVLLDRTEFKRLLFLGSRRYRVPEEPMQEGAA